VKKGKLGALAVYGVVTVCHPYEGSIPGLAVGLREPNGEGICVLANGIETGTEDGIW